MTDDPEYAQYKLRMPVELKRRIDAAAEVGSRSISAEIIKRLEESFDPQPSPVPTMTAVSMLHAWRACVDMSADLTAALVARLDKPDDAITVADEAAIAEMLKQLDYLERSLQQFESSPDFPAAFRGANRPEMRKSLRSMLVNKLQIGSPAAARLIDRFQGEGE